MPAIKFTCPHCSQPLEAPEEVARAALRCPACDHEIPAPAFLPGAARVPEPGGGKCGICLSPVLDSEPAHSCPACRALYHEECWQENGGCAVYGCSHVPVIEKRQAIDIPMSYWGQENKQCPGCKREILAAAVRCRYCGAVFDSARPQGADEFHQRSELNRRLPALRQTVIWLFVFSVLPCLAPIGAVWGAVWYPGRRDDVRALPAIYGALCKIGLAVAIGQTLLIVVLTFLYSFLHR